jgi:hypothetical protein
MPLRMHYRSEPAAASPHVEHWGKSSPDCPASSRKLGGSHRQTRNDPPSPRNVRTVPIPIWVKAALDCWTSCSQGHNGEDLPSRQPPRSRGAQGSPRMSFGTLFGAVPNGCSWIILLHMTSPNVRQTLPCECGELEQIQFLLGHVSVLTTERYLGCKQNLEEPVDDRFGCLFAPRLIDLR